MSRIFSLFLCLSLFTFCFGTVGCSSTNAKSDPTVASDENKDETEAERKKRERRERIAARKAEREAKESRKLQVAVGDVDETDDPLAHGSGDLPDDLSAGELPPVEVEEENKFGVKLLSQEEREALLKKYPLIKIEPLPPAPAEPTHEEILTALRNDTQLKEDQPNGWRHFRSAFANREVRKRIVLSGDKLVVYTYPNSHPQRSQKQGYRALGERYLEIQEDFLAAGEHFDTVVVPAYTRAVLAAGERLRERQNIYNGLPPDYMSEEDQAHFEKMRAAMLSIAQAHAKRARAEASLAADIAERAEEELEWDRDIRERQHELALVLLDRDIQFAEDDAALSGSHRFNSQVRSLSGTVARIGGDYADLMAGIRGGNSKSISRERARSRDIWSSVFEGRGGESGFRSTRN